MTLVDLKTLSCLSNAGSVAAIHLNLETKFPKKDVSELVSQANIRIFDH